MQVLQLLPPLLLPCYALAVLFAFAWLPPLGQDPAYHAFADQRPWAGVPNFADVASNAAMLAAALSGLIVTMRAAPGGQTFLRAGERGYALLYFGALVFTSLGSAWYHLAPDNARLFWDRLPLGLAFTALLALLMTERIVIGRAGKVLLALWVLAGPASVLYWHAGELAGHGDLRPYFLIHVFMFVLPPILLIAAPTPYTHGRLYAWAYLTFLVAMAGDRLDAAVFALTGQVVSGHTLKHLFMGLAIGLLAYMIGTRRLRHR
jgi:hypothetical protein